MDEPTDWEALGRYQAGESPADEADRMRRWLAERPDDAALLQAIDRVMAGIEPTGVAEPDVEQALRQVKASRAAVAYSLPAVSTARSAAARPGARRARSVRMWWVVPALAAAAVVALVARSALHGARQQATPAAAPRSIATGIGRIDSLRLPDGTRIVLGPDSRVDIGSGFGRPARDVALQGQAYFDVRHDVAHPFTLLAGGATIADVGTRFAVRSDGAAGVQVAVLAGMVRLARAGDATRARADSGVMLGAGDRGLLPPAGMAVAVRRRAGSSDTSWTSGRLQLEDVPLSSAATDLRRWYGVQFQFADTTLAARRVTATFDREPIDSVLRVLELSLGSVRLQRQGDTVHVRRSPAAVPAR